jgi:hypothetical protein
MFSISHFIRWVIILLFLQLFFVENSFAQKDFNKKSVLPLPDHIVILIFENHAYDAIIGSTAAPHINALANDSIGALFTHSFAIEHPSQPNYLDLFSGSNQGVTNDNVPTNYPFTTPNLARQLSDHFKTFKTYSENLPSQGYDGASSNYYARKHNPAANWVGTGVNQISNYVNQPLTNFPTDYSTLPTVSFVIPTLVNDMHNGTDPTTITTGDTWMYNNLNGYIQWAKTHNSLLIVTFDEDDNSPVNQITTIFYGPMVKGGTYSETINHYSILRTIEEMHNIGFAGNAATANTIYDCWRLVDHTGISTTVNQQNAFQVFPNPANDKLDFSFDKNEGAIAIEILDAMGRKMDSTILDGATTFSLNTSTYLSGIYFYIITKNNKPFQLGKFIIYHQ